MSTGQKHFELKHREEVLMCKEYEKLRQELIKNLLLSKQKLNLKSAVSKKSFSDLQALDRTQPCAGPPKPSGPPGRRDPARSAAAPLPQLAPKVLAPPAGRLEAASAQQPRTFRAREFYLRSSAFLRYRLPKTPPVIASQAGTSRPVVLKSPLLSQSKAWTLLHLQSPRPSLCKAAPEPAGAAKPAPPAPTEERRIRLMSSSSGSLYLGEATGGVVRKRVRIRTHFMREAPRDSVESARSEREHVLSCEPWEAAPLLPLPERVVPRSIEEIVTSLQSEAQLASDQAVTELIQSVLGPSYQLRMEDIPLMETFQQPEAQDQTEQGLQTVLVGPTRTESSLYQIEQEDTSEWGISDAESLYKAHETQLTEESSEPLDHERSTDDAKAVKQISLKVRSSELLQIKGKGVKKTLRAKLEISEERQRKIIKALCHQKLPKKKISEESSIPSHHELCTTVPSQKLPINLRLASRVYHTASKEGHKAVVDLFGTSLLNDQCEKEEQRYRILHGIPVTNATQEDIGMLPGASCKVAEGSRQLADKPQLELLGEEVCAYPGFTKLFWNPTAPKFSVPVSVMKETLYPKYETVQTSKIFREKFLFESKENVISLYQCRINSKPSFLGKSLSLSNIGDFSSRQLPPLKRIKSAVELRSEETLTYPLDIRDDAKSNIKELSFQKAMELERRLTEEEKIKETVKGNIDTILDNLRKSSSWRYMPYSLIEASRQAGITYIVYPKRKRIKLKRKMRFSKLSIVYEVLSRPPKHLQRSVSHGILPGQKKFLNRIPLYDRHFLSPSLPMILDFDKFAQSRGGIPKNTKPRTWALSLFSSYKHQRESTKEKLFQTCAVREEPEQELQPSPELSDSLSTGLPLEVTEHYKSEVKLLTEEINRKKKYPAFLYCRRGAIYRKLGMLQSAMSDLQEAIRMEPLFLNAYWHRHFIYLFQDRISEALDDLNYINKYNKNNAEVYLSKAEIFKGKNDTTLAIINYSLAIKCKPTDADMYFRRGEMYELENKVLAMDDFSKCIFYDPKRTDALLKRGIYHYENESWLSAATDFTALLKIDPQHLRARTYRGRAYFKRHLYKDAVQDFSYVIHFDPNNWLALYYRACIFRKTNPMRALQDYSVSVLINDGYENVYCFLHRGILYTDLKLWMLAICDFETVISLERTIILAYINIGLTYMLHLDKYVEAAWHFSEAIKIDPLSVQSYMCRAEAYFKLHHFTKAVRELSRAIHLQPDEIQLYIIRGKYLLVMKCYDLAKFTIYQVAEMNKGIIELSPIQQALIYSFCENHDKAIQVLDGFTLRRPDMAMYTMLAKALMKAKKNKEALKMFKKALDVFSHSDKGPNAVAASSDCLYHMGLCYLEDGNAHMALDTFTKAVKANPNFAEGFYQRGLCKVKLRKHTSILDFNRAITINPNHYQAYLSRAAFYGLKGRYSKAILNCNEAIKIYPKSVRAYIYRGVLKYYNRTYQLAIRDLTIAVNMDKNSSIAFYNRAICYTKINECHMALKDYGIVLLLDAEKNVTFNTFVNRALIYTELKQYGYALEDFKQAALVNGTDVDLCQATALCHHRIREFEEAVSFFSQSLQINPWFLDAFTGRGNSYMEYHHDKATKQAQKDFLKALHFNPSYSKARISLGYNLQIQGKFQKAWNQFTIAIEIDPKNYLAYEGRAVVCLQMGDFFAAVQDINTAIKINTTAEFLTNRGVIHEFMGQQQNAMKDYQAAISLDPTYSLAYFNAGNIYFHHRQFSQAIDYFSKALQFEPGNECATMNRAIANTILKKYEEAEKDFACIVESCPLWSAVYFNRAYFHCCLKQYELAEEDLSKVLSLNPDDALVYNLRAEVRVKLGLMEEAMDDYNQALDLQDHAPAI
ncbi:tetratricopeptide repeat protein 6 isoform X2 [Erinaceus europaeus]|nr:tetratricopeptide repeat protein 6 isoform X2 [Erinaceus europaeus]